jgi:hypothetical protein
LELSLRAHRTLGLLWQLSSAVVLSRALWPWLAVDLRRALGSLAYPTLVAGLASVTLCSLLAPHVHPDHVLLLCFSVAISRCLRRDAFARRDWIALAIVPIVATSFKLTGAGIGVGLVLAALFERRWSAVAVLLGSGVLALATIPIFDATLGSFSAYAISLQASHPIEWWRIAVVPHRVSGLILGVASAAWLGCWWACPGAASVLVARRILLLTGSFGAVSLIAFLKHGGRENSLMPLVIGGVVALLVLLGEPRTESSPSAQRSPKSTPALPVVALFWAALSCSWPAAPLTGAVRRQLMATHEQEIRFLSDRFARGQRPWSQGTAAWIDAGRRDTPRDRLSSVSELELARSPAVRAFEDRLTSGQYDALFLSVSALSENDFLRRLRPQLERVYRVAPRQESDSREGCVTLLRRENLGSASSSPD